MNGRLSELFDHVVGGEPALGDEIDEIFRRADKLRRRRAQTLVAAGVALSVAVTAAGYLLATAMVPDARPAPAPVAVPSSAPVATPSQVSDPVLGALVPTLADKRLRIVPRGHDQGDGWRQYSVLELDGKPRGVVEVAVFDAPDALCFPVRAEPSACAHAEKAGDDVEFVRYDDDRDLDWQVHQTVARRAGDGRALVLMSTGERGTGDATRGRPALSGVEVEQLAVGVRLYEAFGDDERCTDHCPAFKVPS